MKIVVRCLAVAIALLFAGPGFGAPAEAAKRPCDVAKKVSKKNSECMRVRVTGTRTTTTVRACNWIGVGDDGIAVKTLMDCMPFSKLALGGRDSLDLRLNRAAAFVTIADGDALTAGRQLDQTGKLWRIVVPDQLRDRGVIIDVKVDQQFGRDFMVALGR